MVEILVSASIIVAVVLAAMAVAQKSIQLSNRSLHTSQASFLLEEGAEAVRILRDNAWNNISSLDVNITYYPTFSEGTWFLSSNSSTIGKFTRTVNIANVSRNNSTGDIAVSGTDDPGTKLITITVFWLEGGQTISKTLPFYITDIFS